MTSAENSVSERPIFLGEDTQTPDPPTSLVPSGPAIMHNRYKKPSYGPASCWRRTVSFVPEVAQVWYRRRLRRYIGGIWEPGFTRAKRTSLTRPTSRFFFLEIGKAWRQNLNNLSVF